MCATKWWGSVINPELVPRPDCRWSSRWMGHAHFRHRWTTMPPHGATTGEKHVRYMQQRQETIGGRDEQNEFLSLDC